MDKIIRKQPAKFNNIQTTITPRTKLCLEGTGADRVIAFYKNWVKDCIPFPEWGWTFWCNDLEDCSIIINIQGNISNINSDINDIQDSLQDFSNDISALQAATTPEAIQDIIAPLLVHGNHVGLTAAYNDWLNEIIFTVTGWGGSFSCSDVATCILTNPATQDALINWIENTPTLILTWDFTFQWDVNFDSNIVTFDWATVNSDNTTYNHTNDNINYDNNTTINWWEFNNNTFNNPTFTWAWVTVKEWPITWTPSWSSLVVVNADSTATSVINGDNITSGTPNGNYFVYDTSTPWQITVTSKDFLWNNISENGIVFYYTITY